MLLTNLRIRTRIFAGFGLLLAIAVAVALFGSNRLGAVGQQVGRMSVAGKNRTRVMEASELLEVSHRSALHYSINSDSASLTTLRSAAPRIEALLNEAEATSVSAERRAIYHGLQDEIRHYAEDIDRLSALRTEIDRHRQDLFVGGDRLSEAADHLVAQATQAGDSAVSLVAADVTRTLLLVRVANWRFLATHDPAGPAKFKAGRDEAEAALGRFEQLAGPEARAMAEPVRSALTAYNDNFQRLSAAMQASGTLYDGQMQPQIMAMQAELAKASDSLRTNFDNSVRTSNEEVEAASWMQTLVTAAAVALGVGLAFAVGRSISRPLSGMTGTMRRLADGDTSVPVPALGLKNEIGDMANAVEVFKANMIKAAELAAEQSREQARKEERQKAIEGHVTGFDNSVRDLLDMLASSATEMQSAAESLSSTANQTNEQATTVAAAAEQASANVQTMAAATEEMAASAGEISRQVARSTQIAGRAVEAARATDRQVQGLAEAAQKIEDVVAIINGIAGQTNLLALNATIEAARAGDAGKGFAVVASEVKALAGQTGKATEQIGAQIQAIQAATREAVEAIKSIGGTINEINDISTSIAAAMEEQGATTSEMTRNTHQAAQGTQDVSATISGVSQNAAATGSAAGQVLSAAGELGKKAKFLRVEVSGFLDKIKAA